MLFILRNSKLVFLPVPLLSTSHTQLEKKIIRGENMELPSFTAVNKHQSLYTHTTGSKLNGDVWNALNKVKASVQFLDPCKPFETAKLYSSQVPFTKAKKPRTNIASHVEQLEVSDIRGHEHLLSLDLNGFELVKHQFELNSWQNGPGVVRHVYPKVESTLR